jgi:hypothetical protein
VTIRFVTAPWRSRLGSVPSEPRPKEAVRPVRALFPLRFLGLAALAAGALYGQLRAGAAKADVTPDLAKHGPVYMAGFGHNRVATAIHDPLFARCLAMQAGRRPLVICEVDSIGIFLDDVEKVRAKLQLLDVVIASTHVHEGPDTMGLWGPRPDQSGINEAYSAFLIDRITEAARAAVKALKPATVTLARRHTPELDSFIHDTRPPELHDSELIILSLNDEAGQSIATAVNWANHPETVGSENTLITADYVGYLCGRIEEQLGGMAVLWNGAVGGMQSPLGATIKDPKTGQPAPKSSFRMAEILGRRVGDIVVDALQGEKPVEVSRLAWTEQKITIPLTNQGYLMAEKAGLFKGRKKMGEEGAPATTTVVGLIRLLTRTNTPLEIALIPGEMYPELSVGGVARYPGADFPDAPVEPALKTLMKADYRMLIGLANDEIGYIIPKAEWDEKAPYLQNAEKRWYGEVNSVGPDAAARIADALKALLAKRP